MADAATEMATTVPPASRTYSFWDTIVLPGVSRPLLIVLHTVFLSLLVALLALLVMVESMSLHVLMICVLAVGLYATLVWFVGEMTLALREHREAEAAMAAAAVAASGDRKAAKPSEAAFGAEVTRRAVQSRASSKGSRDEDPPCGLVRKPVPPPRN